MEGIFVSLLLLVILSIFILVWWFDTRFKFIFSPILLVNVTLLRTIVPTLFTVFYDESYPIIILPIIATVLFVSLNIGYFGMGITNKNALYQTYRYFQSPVLFTPSFDKKVLRGIGALTMLLVGVGTFFYGGLPPVTDSFIALVLEGTEAEAVRGMSEFRRELTKGHIFSGKSYRGQGIVKVLMPLGWGIVTGVTLLMYLIKRERKWLYLFLPLFICSFIYIAAEGTRAPIIRLVVIIFILVSFIKKISLKHISFFTVFLFGFLIFISLLSPKLAVYAEEESFLLLAIGKLFDRIVFVNAMNDVIAIDLIHRNLLEFRNGSLHLHDFLAAIPGSPSSRPFAYELMIILKGRNPNFTYMTGTYLTKTYVDFGLLGTGFLFFMLGLIIARLQAFLYRLPKRPEILVSIVILTSILGEIVITSPFRLISNMIVLSVLFVIFTLAIRLRISK